VVNSHREWLESTTGRKITMNYALKNLLGHGQPGGFEGLLEKKYVGKCGSAG
jgi:hypothetical protein